MDIRHQREGPNARAPIALHEGNQRGRKSTDTGGACRAPAGDEIPLGKLFMSSIYVNL